MKTSQRAKSPPLVAEHLWTGIYYIWLWVQTGEPWLTTEHEQNRLLGRSTNQGLRVPVLTRTPNVEKEKARQFAGASPSTPTRRLRRLRRKSHRGIQEVHKKVDVGR